MVLNDLGGLFNIKVADVLVEDLQKKIKSESFRNYARERGMKLGAMENFIREADGFRKKFLNVDDFKEQIHSIIEGNRNNY